MNELRQKRSNLLRLRQRKQREAYISRMRQQFLKKDAQRQLNTQIEEVLFGAFLCFQEQNGPNLNIYKNIQQIIQLTLFNKQQYFTYKISLYLYINLTTDEVLTYMIEHNAQYEWQRMKHIASHNWKQSQYIYQRMRVFLELLCSKYHIQPYTTYDFNSQQLRSIINEETTKELIIEAFAFDKNQSYYQLVSQYISIMPQSHLIPLALSGFANESLYFENRSICLTILAKLQSVEQMNVQIKELYKAFMNRLMQFHQQ